MHLLWMSLTVNDFVIGDKIGRGRFGHVFKVTGKKDGSILAMKVLFKQELLQNGILAQLLKEVEIQSNLNHKYILRLNFVLQDVKRVYLFTDFFENGSFYGSLKRVGKFPEPIAGKYIRQLLNAVIYLHHNQIIHRDIKPENLLIASNGDLLLADFGWSTQMNNEERMTVCGTVEYLPPEMLLKEAYDATVDCWTCGVLLFEFLFGYPPFVGRSEEEKYSNIKNANYECPEVSPGIQRFFSCALRASPSSRYSAGELFLLPWVQAQAEDGESILQYEQRWLTLHGSQLASALAVEDLADAAFLAENVDKNNVQHIPSLTQNSCTGSC